MTKEYIKPRPLSKADAEMLDMVDGSALRGLLEQWREKAKNGIALAEANDNTIPHLSLASRSSALTYQLCADELEALLAGDRSEKQDA